MAAQIIGSYRLDRVAGVLVGADRRIALSPMEAAFLAYLAERAGGLVEKGELLREVWGYAPTTRSRAVDATLVRVREKLSGTGVTVQAVWGRGLRLTVEPTEEASPPSPSRPLPPDEAVAWWRAHGRAPVSASMVVEALGGLPPVLEAAAALGAALTATVLGAMDPLATPVQATPLGDHLAAAWGALGPMQQRRLQALAVFVPPVDPTSVAELLDDEMVACARGVSELGASLWVWQVADGFGVDTAAVRWLTAHTDLSGMEARHRAFLDARIGTDAGWTWYADVLRARRRSPTWRAELLPGEAWLTRALGADPHDPVDAALIEAFALSRSRRPDQAFDTFRALAEPVDPPRRLRWCLVGAELAGHEGDLPWIEELLAIAHRSLDGAPIHGVQAVRLYDLEVAHLAGRDLSQVKEAALADALHPTPASRAFMEGAYLHFLFQRHPTAAVAARMRALVRGVTQPAPRSMVDLVAAERELGEALSYSEDHVLAYLATEELRAHLHLSLALASLPDLGEAQRGLGQVHDVQHHTNRFRRALLRALLHRDPSELATWGDDVVDRVHRLEAGDEGALVGPGWWALRHVLRARA